MKNLKFHRPIYSELYAVMKEICTVNNPWAFCLSWSTEKPELFNKFMDMCAWYRKDDGYLNCKTKTTGFWYNKKLKKDVLVEKITPDGRVVFWDADSAMWCHDKEANFILDP